MDAKNRAELEKILAKGNRAKDLKDFTNEWIKYEEESAIERLRNTDEDAEIIRRDLLADYRLLGNIMAIANRGTISEQVLKKNKEN